MSNKKETVEVELTPQQKNIQAHITSLTNKINQHQFEIDELMPSLNMYKQALVESMKDQTDKIKKESKNDDN
jgi:predicted transcriptional regulator|tara:strand:+ start:1573 stop:1788 length:216 start_codon:yes stop_codon:yes gene_type:complete